MTSHLEFCLGHLRDKCKDIVVSNNSIVTIVKYAMEVVELTELKGEEQKTMVLNMVKTFIHESTNIDDEVKLMCLDIIDSGMISNMIDLVVDASNGNIDINLRKKIRKFCCM